LLKITEIANRADEGDNGAIKEYNEFMKQPDIENVFYAEKMGTGGDVDKVKNKTMNKMNKYAVGGEIGNQVSFKGDYGTPRSGIVKEKRGSSYIVATDNGDRLVDSYEVISFSDAPIEKKKRFGFFEGGGSIESKKQAILDFINSFHDKPKDWSEATDDLPELHHDIADEYGNKYDFDFNKRSSLRDRNLRHKQHAKSLLNKLSDEEIDKIYSKWEETLEDKFEGGGGIGFIPMDLEDKLMTIAKWGGQSIKGVIGILNAMIDSGITDDDLTPKPIKNTRFQIERAEEKKIQDIWKEIQPKYNGTLKGNQYYSTIKELIQYSNDDILKRYKPFRKYQFENGGGVHTMPDGEVMLNSAHYEGGGEIQSKIDKLNKVVNSKMLPEGVKDKARKQIAELEKELHESKETKAEEKEEDKKGGSEAKKPTTKKPTTRKAPVKKAAAKKVVVKKEVKGDLPKSKFEKGDKVGVSGHNEVYEIKDKSYRNDIEGELTWVYYLPEYSSVLVSEKNLKVVPKPKADHKKLVAKLKAKKGATPSNEPSKGHKRSESSDRKREALPLGKRVSADGNTYYENRLNRADMSKEDKFKEGGEVKSSGWGLKFLKW
jgi:hypothetical protein